MPNEHVGKALADLQSFRKQLEDSIGTEFPSVPLPPRRHQPIRPNGVTDETEINGPRENGTIKHEEMKDETPSKIENEQPIANGTHS